MSDSAALEFFKLAEALKKKIATNRLASWKPYPKQKEFMHCKSKIKVLFGANQSGKTTTVCAELTYHLTGIYPEDWNGVKYTRPVDIWIAGETNVRVRDTLQEKLFGRPGQMGTGTIPKAYIDEDSMIRKAGIPYAIDIARIRHHTDGIEDGLSTLQFFSYDMKREAFQGSTVDIIEFDEEPPDDINDECKMRVIAKSGRLFYTFTPLKGMTPLWNELNKNEDVAKFWLTWDDITHLKEEDKNALIKGMSEDQIRARKYGVATVGSSQIFQFQEEDYVCDDFEIPAWWPRMGGLDIGVNHPTGAVAAAYDEEADTIYFYREYQVAGKSAPDHALHLRKWCLPSFATDRSAWQRDKASALTVASVYEDCGLKLVSAGNVAGSWESSVFDIRARIREGRFFIFKSLGMLKEQMKLYRTKEDGITVVKKDDDLIDPMRYVCMNIKSAAMRKNDANSDIIMPREDGPFNSYSII